MINKERKTFEKILLNSPNMEDDQFTMDLYRALCNNVWYNTEGKQIIGYSWRVNAAFISGVKSDRLNHDYHDDRRWQDDQYYNSGNEGVISDRIKEFMHSNGIVLFENFYESLQNPGDGKMKEGLNLMDNDFDPCGTPTNYDRLITVYLRDHQLNKLI